jgi:hypothetical protein
MNKRNFAQRKFRSRRYRAVVGDLAAGDRRNRRDPMDHYQEPAQQPFAGPASRADAIRADEAQHPPHTNCRTITGHGYEILSDYQRSLLKLPPRGPDGWTVEEVLAWDAYRVASMFKPIVMTELTPEQERDLRQEWGSGSGAIAWISPTTQSEK